VSGFRVNWSFSKL